MRKAMDNAHTLANKDCSLPFPTGPDRRLVVAIMVLSHDYCASRIKLRKSQ